MAVRVKHTYAKTRGSTYSFPPTLHSSPAQSRKGPLQDVSFLTNTPVPKKRTVSKLSAGKTRTGSSKLKGKACLTQLHFSLDTSILRSCPLCDLSYTKSAPDDEALHKVHCARVRKGMEWGREEERELGKSGFEEIRGAVQVKDGRKGRVVSVRADATGKIGAKVSALLDTVNIALTSPPMTTEALKASKAYLFLLPSGTAGRETIVGCAVAERISTAMSVVALPAHPKAGDAALIPLHITPTTSLHIHPTPLPTPLGIPRLFVSSAHRRQGIAKHLLEAAAATAIYGCNLDPKAGQIAFTQPTNSGRAVMESWGNGGVRIYAG